MAASANATAAQCLSGKNHTGGCSRQAGPPRARAAACTPPTARALAPVDGALRTVYLPVRVDITVNGTARQVAAGCTVAELVASLGLRPEHVAVERNREIVPRAQHGTTALGDGDQLEIVTFVGGG
jgi:sulfur carrier protein